MHTDIVEILFDYCQIGEAIIMEEGWPFLIRQHGIPSLFDMNAKSGWFDCENQAGGKPLFFTKGWRCPFT